MCEVWFHVGKEAEYEEMFSWLQEYKVQIGLHHWGVVDDKFKTNLATQNEHVRRESLAQMKKTIDIGKEIGAVYVNVHPGARWLEEVDLEKGEQSLVAGSETSADISAQMLLRTAQELHEYSNAHGVVLTIETMLGREAKNYLKREGLYNSGTPPLSLMEKLTGQGIFLANDITHTAGALAVTDNSREGMWRSLQDFTKRTAAYTKLIHVNTVIPPFDGRDSHNGLLEADFAEGGFPSRDQIVELLRLFAKRNDVFAVSEPQLNKTSQNYLALKKIAEEAGVG